MTNEEAINFGKIWLDMNEDAKDSDTYRFIELAIKTLKQQSSEDCISREALLNSLKGFEILHNHDELRSNLIYGIMNLPSVTPTIFKMEQVEDCVARSEALDILDDFEVDIENGKFKTAYAKARERMCELSSVTPQQTRWIPVSERLPETDTDVLVTNGIGMYIGWIDPTDKNWRVDSESEYFFNDEVIAWQPLPEPYRESEE